MYALNQAQSARTFLILHLELFSLFYVGNAINAIRKIKRMKAFVCEVFFLTMSEFSV